MTNLIKFFACFLAMLVIDGLVAQHISKLSVASSNGYNTGQSFSNYTRIFSDRDYTFQGIPAQLRNAEYLVTAMNDKFVNEQVNFLNFYVDVPGVLFIAYDSRYSRTPVWMNQFAALNDDMALKKSDGSTTAIYKLYSKQVSTGWVSLGGNIESSEKGNYGMYSVFFIPEQSAKVDFRVNLNEIYVIDEADGSGNAEPYMWNVFFKIDQTALTHFDRPENNWIFFKNGEHGNIGDDYDSGDTRSIPPQIGFWNTQLDYQPKMGFNRENAMVGFITILLEEDDFPTSSELRNKHYPDFKAEVIRELQCSFLNEMKQANPAFYNRFTNYGRKYNCNGGSGSSGGSSKVGRSQSCFKGIVSSSQLSMSTALGNKISKRLKDKFSGAPVNIDDVIGVGVYIFPLTELQKLGSSQRNCSIVFDDNTGSEDGDFQLNFILKAQVK